MSFKKLVSLKYQVMQLRIITHSLLERIYSILVRTYLYYNSNLNFKQTKTLLISILTKKFLKIYNSDNQTPLDFKI